MFDFLIVNGLLVDGSGKPPFRSDIGIEGGRIAAIGNLGEAAAARLIDASGLAVAPGFIDIHTHSEITLLAEPAGMSKIRQGVTTEVCGNCGYSVFPTTAEQAGPLRTHLSSIFGDAVEWTWSDLPGYREAVAQRGVGMNIVPLVGHSAVRSAVMGFDDRPATADDIRAMQRLISEAMEQGAFGFSTGLTLPPSAYGDTDEVVALAQAMAATPGRIYSTHARVWAGNHIGAIEEAVEIGRRAGVPVHVAHMAINDPSYWGEAATVNAVCEEAVAEGLDVTFDVYPYDASSSGFDQCISTWAQSGGKAALLARLRDPKIRQDIYRDMAENGLFGGWPWLWDRLLISTTHMPKAKPYEGMTIQQAAEVMDRDPLNAALDLMDMDEARMEVIFYYRTEEDMLAFLRHPLGMMGSDGLAISPNGQLGRGKPHPRSYGAHARVLGRYVREVSALTLAEAVYKMSGQVADRLGLKDRGRLRQGQAADVVIFDPATVQDEADFQNPHQYATGIPYVLVNGQMVVDGGEHTGALVGQVLEPV